MLQLRRAMVITAVTVLAVAPLGSGRAAAQGTRATVRGTVRAGGAPRPNVTVNVINLDNQNERQAITETDGTWTIGGLPPGRYEVRVDETGFQPYRSAAITLTAGQQQTNDITLQAVAAPPPPIPPPAPTQPRTQPSPTPPQPAQPPTTPVPAARATLRGTVRVGRSTRSNVTVNVVNLENQNERQAISELDGTWAVGGLQPGRYEVRVDDAGYRPYKSGTITLTAGQQRTADISLEEAARTSRTPPRAQPSGRPPPPAVVVPDYIPSPDRWHLEFPTWQRYPPDVPGAHPYVDRSTLGPYTQTMLKGDYPAFGTQDVFLVLTGVLEVPFEYRRLPTPSGVSQSRPGSDAFFGKPEQYSFVSEAVGSLEIFKGDTSFKPRTWAVRVTPVFNLNYTNTQEFNVVNATPEEGRTRRRTDVALQEAFGEYKLADVGSNYDFISIRAGIQPFTSDFRGFLYRDSNLGVRLFGTWGRNKNQWNLAAFDQLQKETNSELNLFERRDQKVLIANYFRQDFLTEGYTISPSVHANFDKGAGFFYDANGFLVQPSPIGLIQPHEVKAYYVGLAGDGHWGALNVSHQFYQAFGTDQLNGIAGKPVDINAQFAAAEVSVDHDWWRLKGTFVYASGDRDPEDNKANGFDAIFDNPNVVGGSFSFWNREGIRLAQTSVGLVARASILPSLRSSKTEGQANFVNPGLFLYNAGIDAELTEKLRVSVNANYLQFQYVEPLQRVLFQSTIEKTIGMDYSAGFQWRPTLNDQIVVTGGASLFMPSPGFKNILTADKLFAPFLVLTLRY